MDRNVIYKKIRQCFAKIYLCDYLESICSSDSPYINHFIFSDLIILANRSDIFCRDVIAKDEYGHYMWLGSNPNLKALLRLHLVTITYEHQVCDFYYVCCELTDLGHDFVDNFLALDDFAEDLFNDYRQEHPFKNFFTRNSNSLDIRYNHLQEFVDDPVIYNITGRNTPFVTKNTIIEFIADHLDEYTKMIHSECSPKSLLLRVDAFFKPEKHDYITK